MDGWNYTKLGSAIEEEYKRLKNLWLSHYLNENKRQKLTVKLILIVIFLQIISLIK
jgi:hypothetical protein